MTNDKAAFTQFGMDVHMFCAKNNLTKKDLAEMSGISYVTLLHASKGHRPGHDVVPHIYEFMQRYESENRGCA